MSFKESQRAAPSESEVRSQVRRIVTSQDFVASERLQEFLEFVVEAALQGQTDRIKGYTIATEVFGRGDDFDPQTDPIVRVEAGRLRRRLEHYYLAEGEVDPILIEIPKGGYIPRFSCRDGVSGEPVSQKEAHPDNRSSTQPSGRNPVFVGLAFGFLIGLAAGLGWILLRPEPEISSEKAKVSGQQRPFRVMVSPFDYVTDTNPHPLLNEGLVNELIITLAALPEVDVLALRTAREAIDRGLTPQQLSDSLEVDYLIQGQVRQQQADVRVSVSVIDAPTAVIRESRQFEGTFDRVFDLEEEIARGIASIVSATQTPSFNRRIEGLKNLDPEVIALYYEATTLRDPPSDPTRSRLAEEAYRRVIELDPEFAGGYAGLAYVLAFRSWWKVGEDPEIDGQKALEAARKAVDRDPDLGWAQMSLGIALNIAGDHEGALEAARRAAEMSGDDPYVLSFSALIQTFEGEVDAAVPLARAALRLDPLSVRTPFRNILGAILFQAGEYQESLDVLMENLELGGPDGPHVAHWRAGSLAALDRPEEARRELTKASSFPYNFDMQDFLSAFRNPIDGGKLLEVLEPLALE
jgi:TolB-like protein/cytochrome c-type biogenesis protein CcmH/NrfG